MKHGENGKGRATVACMLGVLAWIFVIAGGVGVTASVWAPTASAACITTEPDVDPPSCGPPGCIQENPMDPPPYNVYPENCIPGGSDSNETNEP